MFCFIFLFLDFRSKVERVHINFALTKLFYLAESVESLMSETHELGGTAVVVDRATPKARV